MNKDRLAAFTDAILAIIMTILVLELEKPAEASWAAVWELRQSFASYIISFFWLGAMWVNLHSQWQRIDRIVYQPGEIKKSPVFKQAYEMGKTVR